MTAEDMRDIVYCYIIGLQNGEYKDHTNDGNAALNRLIALIQKDYGPMMQPIPVRNIGEDENSRLIQNLSVRARALVTEAVQGQQLFPISATAAINAAEVMYQAMEYICELEKRLNEKETTTREFQAESRGQRMSIQPVDDAACLTEEDKKRLLLEFAKEET